MDWRDRDIIDDVRRLRRDVDALAAGLHAGFTSLGAGDGSMDIMDGSTVVARFGDTGAGLGVSVRDPDNGSREVLIQDLLERRRQAIYSVMNQYNENRINDIKATNERVETYNRNRISDISTLNGRVDATNSRLEGYNQARKNDISSLNGRVDALSSRLEGYNQARKDQIAAVQGMIQTELAAIKARLQRLERGGGGTSPL